MTIRNLVIGGALVAFAAIAIGVAVWWFAIRSDAKLATSPQDIPTELIQTTSTPHTSATGAVQSFRVVPEQSEAAYFADEELASIGLPSTAKGSTQGIEGEFYLTHDGLDLASAPVSAFTVDLTGLRSDKDMRDRRVQEALNTAQFPTATFTATSVTGYDPSIPEGEEQSLQLSGTLDLHGVQNEVMWSVKAVRQANVISALATVTFPYSLFDISPPNIAGFVSVGDDVTLQMQIIAEAV